MGSQLCCCRRGSSNDEELEMAQTPPSEQTTRPAETAEPAEWPEQKTDSEDAGRDRAASAAHYANSIFDHLLKVGSLVPFAGKFCELIADTKAAIEELGDTIDDANDVITWAAAQEIFFRAIVDTTKIDIKSLVLRPDVSKRDDLVVRLWDLDLASSNVGVGGAQRAIDAMYALHGGFSQVELTVEDGDGKIVLAGTAPPSFDGWEKLDETLRTSFDQPIDEALCKVAADAWEKMEELKDAARDILGSSSNKSLCKCACLMGRVHKATV